MSSRLASLVFVASVATGCGLSGDVLVNTTPPDLIEVMGDVDMAVVSADMGPGCGLNTCASMGAKCGPIGDGCGGVLNCGTCAAPQTCGGGGTPFECGGTAACTPLKCSQLNLSCGMAGDGCGNTINCGTCPAGETCGGGGMPGKCGVQTMLPADAGVCIPKTCGTANCGQVSDGCGNLIPCGSCTLPGETCGGGGVPFQCGKPPCVPKTCAMLGANCGQVGDGCGGLTASCGTCNIAGQTCGGGGMANVCGSPACVPKTCVQLGKNCGAVGDGCGGLIAGGCGTCTMVGQSCGGGGIPNVCGGPTCVPKTCAMLSVNCGAVGDGCGGLIPGGCGTCTNPGDICGAFQPNVCGNPGTGGAGTCDMGQTTITGTVLAPTDSTAGFGNPDPIFNATVFVPSAAGIQPIVTGATCDKCTTTQPAIVSATTGIDGKFTLVNPPTGAGVKVVIQLGKWRRVLTLNVVPCVNNVLTAAQTRLPRRQAEFDPLDNIPRFAIATGDVDVMECVLRKMGVGDPEFVNPNISGVTNLPQATGRIHMYQTSGNSNGQSGARINNMTPGANTLYGNQTTINAYDAVLFPCTGGRDNRNAADQQRVIDYTTLGGRVFTTHFSYVWLYDHTPWGCGNQCTTAGQTVANWHLGQLSQNGPFQGFVDQTFPRGIALANWLQQPAVGASTTLGQIPVFVVRQDTDAVVVGQQWLHSTNPPNSGPATFPLHFTFNTPTTALPADQCGRVVFSDFHVENSGGSHNVAFPTECNANAPLTAQEKLLEFMLFDLTSCVAPDVPTCTPKTCAQLGYNCGMQGDGCGGTQNCGMCSGGQVCGGGSLPGVCFGSCTPQTCAQLGFTCGTQGDGCGGTQSCGNCTPPASCGGGGTPGVCGGGCTPLTCQALGAACGVQGNGCGGLTANCGNCTPPQSCGGGGVPNQCGGGCVPRTCAQQGLNCGPAGDGCGNVIQCGNCPAGQTCGGGGVNGQCGSPPDGGVMCPPLTCAGQGINCGPAGDGCGNLLNCGPCPPGQTCGGGGVPGECGAPNCTPTTCAAAMAECGIIGNGCGGQLDCGTCVPPLTCGGAGVPFKCGIIN